MRAGSRVSHGTALRGRATAKAACCPPRHTVGSQDTPCDTAALHPVKRCCPQGAQPLRTATQQPALSCSITYVFRYASFSHFHSSKWLLAEWGEDKFTTC